MWAIRTFFLMANFGNDAAAIGFMDLVVKNFMLVVPFSELKERSAYLRSDF